MQELEDEYSKTREKTKYEVRGISCGERVPTQKPVTGQTESYDYELRTNLAESILKADGELSIKIQKVQFEGQSLDNLFLQIAVDQMNPQMQSIDPEKSGKFNFQICKQKTAVLRIFEGQKLLSSKNYPPEN